MLDIHRYGKYRIEDITINSVRKYNVYKLTILINMHRLTTKSFEKIRFTIFL